MSRNDSNHYQWYGWTSGEDSCDPPEPGKEWLTITENDDHEIAIIVLRVDAFEGRRNELALARKEREERADMIVAALNAHLVSGA